jgi:hypothetical protein
MNIRNLVSEKISERAPLHAIATIFFIGFFVLPAASQSNTTEASTEISQALSAAPASIAAQASVVVYGEQGRKKVLREGTNGWTCMMHDPNLPHDGIAHHSACFDKYGMEWTENYLAGREPNPDHVGYSYMLEGGSSWSNTDPHANKLAPGQKDYIRIPPHIMLLNAKLANPSGFPAGAPDPDTHKPFVMFGGTPFAILIIPVN